MGRVRLTRPFVLLALAALLAPPAEASRTSVWERNPPASLKATTPDAAGLLASLAPAAAADTEIAEPALFNLGDVVLADTADADAEHFDLGPLTLVDLNHLRGPPPSYPETRVRGFELLPPFRVGPSPSLSLWSRQACGSISCELVSDSPEDPWGLETGAAFGAIDRRDRGITNPIAGTIDPEAVAREAAATAVEEFSYVGIANGLSSSLLGYDFVRNEEVKGPLARALAGVSVVPGIPATIRKLSDVPVPSGLLRQADEVAEAAAARAKQGGRETAMASRPAEDAVSEALAVPTNREAPRETVRIPGTSRSGFRVTDLQALGENGTIALRGSIVEVKDVARLEARGQIRDFIAFAEGQGLKVEIFTNAPEPVRGKIADAIRRGTVVLRPIPKKKS